MLKEFKEFAVKGNMIGAFNAIVTSLVNDIIMPALSIFTGKLDFSHLFIALNGEHYETLDQAQALGVATINYGSFITGVINFLIMAFVVFLMVRSINKVRRKNEPEAAVTVKNCSWCQSEIHIDAKKCPYCTSEVD